MITLGQMVAEVNELHEFTRPRALQYALTRQRNDRTRVVRVAESRASGRRNADHGTIYGKSEH